MTKAELDNAEDILRMLCRHYISDFGFWDKHCKRVETIINRIIEELRRASQ